MKITQLFLTLILSFASQPGFTAEANVEKEGEELYKTHCSACHGNTGGMDMSQRLSATDYSSKNALYRAIPGQGLLRNGGG